MRLVFFDDGSVEVFFPNPEYKPATRDGAKKKYSDPMSVRERLEGGPGDADDLQHLEELAAECGYDEYTAANSGRVRRSDLFSKKDFVQRCKAFAALQRETIEKLSELNEGSLATSARTVTFGPYHKCLPLTLEIHHKSSETHSDRCGNVVASSKGDYTVTQDAELWYDEGLQSFFLNAGSILGKNRDLHLHHSEGFEQYRIPALEKGACPQPVDFARFVDTSLCIDEGLQGHLLIGYDAKRSVRRSSFSPPLLERKFSYNPRIASVPPQIGCGVPGRLTLMPVNHDVFRMAEQSGRNIGITWQAFSRLLKDGLSISTEVSGTDTFLYGDVTTEFSDHLSLKIRMVTVPLLEREPVDEECTAFNAQNDLVAARVAALLSATRGDGADKLQQSLRELIDRTRASLEEGFRVWVKSASNADLIERALRLNDMLFSDNPKVGPWEKSAIAETLLAMHEELDIRVQKAPRDPAGRPVLEGVTWAGADPLAGIVEDIPPFGMVDWWSPFVLEGEEKSVAPRRPVRRIPESEFEDEVVEGPRPLLRDIPPSNKHKWEDDEFREPWFDTLLRAKNYLETSDSPSKETGLCMLKKVLWNRNMDDRILMVNAYTEMERRRGGVCRGPDDVKGYTYTFRSDIRGQTRHATNAKGYVKAVERTVEGAQNVLRDVHQIQNKFGAGGGSAADRVERKAIEWLAARIHDRNSIFSCFLKD